MTRGALLALVLACGGAQPPAPARETTMQADHEYDFLLGATREVFHAHVDADAARIARVRAALREDARPEVRRNAIVALTAARKAAAVPDYIAALDDAAPAVAAEAVAALAAYGPASLAGPANEPALAALRAHAARLRALLAAPEDTTRFNALCGLVAIADAETPLATVLGDTAALVRREALELAKVRTLGTAEVAALEAYAAKEPDAQLRVQAVNLVAARAPQLGQRMLVAALARGDADRTTASLVTDAKLVALVPAIIAYLNANPKQPYFFATLAAFGATCAAKTIAQLARGPWNEAFAIDALQQLSGHTDWSSAQLLAWANAQPDCPP